MQDRGQFEQLMMMYNQLKNGSEDIKRLISNEDYDGAITMIKAREPIFLNCKCMRKFLELTPDEETELNTLLDEIRALEVENMQTLEKNMLQVKMELRKTQQNNKIQHAYDIDTNSGGSLINIEE